MSNFKITFGPEWDKLRKNLQSDEILARIVPDVSLAILKLNNVLEDRVKSIFNAPGSLNSVRIGNTVAPESLGKTFLRYSLQYRDVPIPLAKFPYTETRVSANAKYPNRLSNGFVRWTPKSYAIETKVAIRKGKFLIAKRGNKYTQKGFVNEGRILAREQKATWSTFPSKNVTGVRAPFSELYGPSLATLAAKVYDVDPVVAKAKERVQEDILDAVIRGYNA
jgi:hypothetical protein